MYNYYLIFLKKKSKVYHRKINFYHVNLIFIHFFKKMMRQLYIPNCTYHLFFISLTRDIGATRRLFHTLPFFSNKLILSLHMLINFVFIYIKIGFIFNCLPYSCLYAVVISYLKNDFGL